MFFKSLNKITDDRIFPITVATAAPVTPMPNPNINIGSKMIFVMVPERFAIIGSFIEPSALIIFTNPFANIINGHPKAKNLRYKAAKSL